MNWLDYLPDDCECRDEGYICCTCEARARAVMPPLSLTTAHRNFDVRVDQTVHYRHWNWTVVGIRHTRTETHYALERRFERTVVTLQDA